MNQTKKTGIALMIWGIIVVTIFILLTVFGFTYKNKTKDYKDLEEKLVEAEKKYVDAKFLYPDDKNTIKTNAEVLIKEGFLENTKVKDETCDGYATIQKNGMSFEYKGYVKCKNYKTKGYEK